MEWPSFLRLQNQGSTTSAFNCLCEPPALNAFPFNRRTSKVAQCRVWCCTSGRSGFAARLCLAQLWIFIPTVFWSAFFCITFLYHNGIFGPPSAGFVFLNGQSCSDDGFASTDSWCSSWYSCYTRYSWCRRKNLDSPVLLPTKTLSVRDKIQCYFNFILCLNFPLCYAFQGIHYKLPL